MYLTRAEGMVAAGRPAEYEAFLDRLFDLLSRQTGILAAAALNSRGYPSKYALLTRWESRAAAKAFMRGAALADLVRANPLQGIYTPSRPVEAYEVVHRIAGAGRLGAVYLIDEVVANGPGNLQAFEQSRGQMYELRRQHGPGFALSMLSRFLGGDNRYLIFGAFANQGDDVATANTPEIQRFQEEYAAEFKLVVRADREFYEIVKTALPEPV